MKKVVVLEAPWCVNRRRRLGEGVVAPVGADIGVGAQGTGAVAPVVAGIGVGEGVVAPVGA